MRIIHTSDWHAGKRLNRESRLVDLTYALEQISDFAKKEKVDFIIHSGDVFDSVNPSSEAQGVVFDFFLKMHREGVRSIIVAGNHDSIGFFKSLKGIISLASCYIYEKPQLIEPLRLSSKDGQTLVVYPLPYPHPNFMIQLEKKAKEREQVTTCREEEREQVTTYREKVKNMLTTISEKVLKVRGDFKILVTHLMLDSAKIAGSERSISVLTTYSISENVLSPYFDYFALGHIHRPQKIANSKEIDIRYAGSPYQLDFGEAEEDKSFVFIDVEHSGRVKTEINRLTLKRPLKVFKADEKNLDQVVDLARKFDGLKKFEISLENPIVGLNERIWREVPGVIFINTHSSNNKVEKDWKRTDFNPQDVLSVYREYHKSVHNKSPSPKKEELIKKFLEEIERKE